MRDAAAPAWPAWFRLEASNWLFVLRTVIGILVALAIAFRLDLSNPGSAAVTVSIIALPQAGMVLEKSFYRLLGTLLGAAVTLILLANLVQQRDAFILAVALWIGLCTAASSWFRGFQAYGWLLCGYTTCLIGFPAFMDAGHAFDIAVDRVSIVCVGILSAGVVNAVILPSRSTSGLVSKVRASVLDFAAFLEATTRPGDAGHVRALQHRFSFDLAALETVRASSAFEDPESRVRGPRLFGFVGAFLLASLRLHVLHHQLRSLGATGRADVLAAVEPQLQTLRDAFRVAGRLSATALDAAPVADRLDAAFEVSRLETIKVSDTPELVTRILIRESIEGTRNLAVAYADLHAPRGRDGRVRYARPRPHFDALQALLSGVRAVLLVLATCAFWIASAWPDGFSMTFLAVVGCALLSSAPNPARAALEMCKGFGVAVPALLVCYTWVLPGATDFVMLSLGLVPFLAFGAWLMTRPGQMLVGSGYFLLFLTALNLTGVMNYDFLGMFNNLVGLLFGISVAAVSLAVIVPPDRSWRPQRALRLLLDSLGAAQRDPLPGLPARFQSRTRDLTIQVATLRSSEETRAADERLGIVILAGGDAIVRLREIHGRLAQPLADDVAAWMETLASAVSRQDAGGLRMLDGQLAARGDFAAESLDEPVREALIVAVCALRLAIEDGVSAFTAEGVRHAA